jgi:acyl-CoA reductase-like NAD-dependent aldehyde dehydrogenase
MFKILTYNVIYLFELLTLPFIQVNKIQESIGFINSRPKPLTIYAFTKDDAFKRKIVAETSSGSVIFNDTLVQVMLLLPHLIFIL